MAFGRGKRVAILAVALGMLVLAAAGLAYRGVFIEKWRSWKDEERAREMLSGVRISCAFKNRPLPEVLQFLSQMSGVKLEMSPEVSTAVKEGLFRVQLRVSDEPGDILLRSVLASAGPDLDYTVKGDTVEIEDPDAPKYVLDPWSSPYVYRENRSRPPRRTMKRPTKTDLYSTGPDGLDQTITGVAGDDIGSW